MARQGPRPPGNNQFAAHPENVECPEFSHPSTRRSATTADEPTDALFSAESLAPNYAIAESDSSQHQ